MMKSQKPGPRRSSKAPGRAPKLPAGKGRLAAKTEISASGVAVRRNKGELDIALISVGDPPRWQLPKGHVDTGETARQAAVREVREEAGIEADLLGRIEWLSRTCRAASVPASRWTKPSRWPRRRSNCTLKGLSRKARRCRRRDGWRTTRTIPICAAASGPSYPSTHQACV